MSNNNQLQGERPAEAEEQKSLSSEEISRLREEVLRAIGKIKLKPKKKVSKRDNESLRVVFARRKTKKSRFQKSKSPFYLWKWGIFLLILILLLGLITWLL